MSWLAESRFTHDPELSSLCQQVYVRVRVPWSLRRGVGGEGAHTQRMFSFSFISARACPPTMTSSALAFSASIPWVHPERLHQPLLLNLPPEIKHEILLQCSPSTLAVCCLVSRSFLFLSGNILYAKVHIHGEKTLGFLFCSRVRACFRPLCQPCQY